MLRREVFLMRRKETETARTMLEGSRSTRDRSESQSVLARNYIAAPILRYPILSLDSGFETPPTPGLLTMRV
jgi:hypothetical protein